MVYLYNRIPQRWEWTNYLSLEQHRQTSQIECWVKETRHKVHTIRFHLRNNITRMGHGGEPIERWHISDLPNRWYLIHLTNIYQVLLYMLGTMLEVEDIRWMTHCHLSQKTYFILVVDNKQIYDMPSSEQLWRKPPQDKTIERVVREGMK